jgi:hypothetical protein
MTDLQRFRDIKVLGVQTRQSEASCILCNDPETGTTFSVHPGETIGAALERVEERYRAVMKGSHGGGHRVHR